MRFRSASVAVGAAALVSSAAAALDFTLGVGPSSSCATSALHLRAVALTYLEPAPVLQIDEYGGRHYDPVAGDNQGLGYGYADLTVPLGRSCVGVFYRADFVGVATRDALDAVVANHDRQPFEVGRTYKLGVDSNDFEAVGLKATRVLSFRPTDGWSIDVGVTGSLMKALSYHAERVRGDATAISGRYAVGTASWSRTMSDYDLSDFNPFVEKADPRGYGYSVDMDIVLRSRSGFRAQFTVMDAWSQINWQNVPRSDKRADNETIRYDVNLNRQAFIQGLDHRVDVGYVMEPRYRIAASMPLRPGLTVVLSDDYLQGTHFPAVGLAYDWNGRLVEANFDESTNALSLSFQQGWFGLSITSDQLDIQRASVLGARIGFMRSW